jgi:hypothetical protein
LFRTLRVTIDRATQPFVLARVLIALVITLPRTWLSMAIADHVGTPEFLRWIVSPGYVLGVHFAWGRGFSEHLSSFMLIALTANLSYYGFACFLLLRGINWPKTPRNPRHLFWMDRQ